MPLLRSSSSLLARSAARPTAIMVAKMTIRVPATTHDGASLRFTVRLSGVPEVKLALA
jgi:hypothetical protein